MNTDNLRGVTAGAFDFLHAGHIRMLRECKQYCGHLTVFLQTDPTIDRPKKNRPVQSLYERWCQLQAVKYVDEIITYETEADLVELLKHIHPDVRILGADWADKEYTGKEECRELGIVPIFNSRNHDFSSTNLRKRLYAAEKKRK